MAYAQTDILSTNPHGCLPAPKIPYKWPLGLDILKFQYDALRDGRVLASLSRYLLDEEGEGRRMTLGLNDFGRVGYVTTDPRNIEAMLGVGVRGRFEGMCFFVVLVFLLFWCRDGSKRGFMDRDDDG